MYHYLLLTCAVYSLAVAAWRLQFFNEFETTLTQGIPFTVIYNESVWTTADYSWYTNEDCCIVTNRSHFSTQVVCKQYGLFPFGVQKQSLGNLVTEYRSLKVLPGYYYSYWKLQAEQISSLQFLVRVSVASYNNSSLFGEYLSEQFPKLQEKPNVYILSDTLNQPNEKLNISFDEKHGYWFVHVFLSISGASVIVIAESSTDELVNSCLIRETKIRLTTKKYAMDVIDGTSLSQAYAIHDGIITDHYSPHVTLLVHDHRLWFPQDSFTYMNIFLYAENPLLIDRIHLLKDCIAVIAFGRAFLYFQDGSLQQIRNVVHQGIDSWVAWVEIFSCKSIQKGLNKDYDVIFLLNNDKEYGNFFSYGVQSQELFEHEIPFCKYYEYCHILHMEISSGLGLVRLLYEHCVDFICRQNIVDYYYAVNYFKLILKFKGEFTSFHFWPVGSYDMLLFSKNDVYQLIDGEFIWRYKINTNTPNQIVVFNDASVILFTTGYALYLQYGGTAVYEIFLGENMYIYPVDYLLFSSWLNGSSVVKEIIPLTIQLDAAYTNLKEPILHFETSIQPVLYYLDMIDSLTITAEFFGRSNSNLDVKMIYDRNVGLHINVTEHRITENFITGVNKTFILTLGSGLQGTYPKTTTVTLVPYGFNGFHANSLWKQQLAHIALACTPGRRLHLLTQLPSCKENLKSLYEELLVQDVTSNKYCVAVQVHKDIEMNIKIFDHAQETDLEIAWILDVTYGLKDSVKWQNSVARVVRVSVEEPGRYLLKVAVDPSTSMCDLTAYMVVVANPIPDNGHTVIIFTSISIGVVLCLLGLLLSFIIFKKRTSKEYEEEANIQKRQQELRYLVSTKDYQDQMEINVHPAVASMARRRSSLDRKRSFLIPASRRSSLLEKSSMPSVKEE